MAVEQEDLDLALTHVLTSVLGTMISTEKKPSDAFGDVRRILDSLQEEAKKDPTYE